MKSAYFFVSLLLLLSSAGLKSQPTNQDCLGAIAICQPIFTESNAYSGTGNVANEINSATSCLSSGEKNDVWYTFTVTTGGLLCFTITPNVLADDYDWAVYNLTSAACSDIFGNPALEVACNFNVTPGPTGPNGLVGDQNEACMTVSVGDIYAVNVSQFSPSPNGYTIDFSSSSASIFDSSTPVIQSVDNVITCGGSTVVFSFSESVLCSTVNDGDFTLSGPGGPFTLTGITGVTCSGGGAQEIQFTATISPAISAGGSYSVCLASGSGITDLCGNVSPAACLSFTVAGLSISTVSFTDVTCFGASTGTATVAASGGTGPFTYNWATLPAQAGATATGLSGGIWSVTATDVTGCSGTGTVTISTPVVIPDKFDLTCDSLGCDGSAGVTPIGGSSPYSYQWTDEFMVAIPGETSSTISSLCAGAWCVITTDAAACKDTTCVSIILPSFVITPALTSCIGLCDGTATLTANGGTPPFTYQWENPLGTPIVGETDSIMDSLCAGTYYLRVETGNACTLIDSVVVSDPTSIIASINTFKNACFGVCDGSATVTTTGGSSPYTYLWNDPDTQTVPVATGLCLGSYIVSVTDANGCGPDTASISLVENPEITTTSLVTNQSCDSVNGSATIAVTPGSGSPPYSYLWDSPGASTSTTATGLFAGSWVVAVTDSAQCTDSTTVQVGFADSAQGMINIINLISCKDVCDGELSVTYLNGDTMSFQNWSIKDEESTIDSLCPDTFTVLARDSNNCPVFLTQILVEPDSITSTLASTSETSCNSQDGTITITPAGGTLPYTFTWSPNVSSTAAVTGLSAGTYSVTIEDVNNCPRDSQTVTLIVPPGIIVDTLVTPVTCFGYNDGSVSAFITSGGAQPYTFTWSSSGTVTGTDSTSLNSGLVAGTYTVSVTDINNCPMDSSVSVVIQPDIINTTATPGCLDGEGTAFTATTGGTQPYDYIWSNASIFSDLLMLEPGTYSVTVTDVNNCPPDEATVFVQPCAVEIPTAFTPNDDGENDLWDLKNIKYFEDAKINVYNRWGDLVYKSKGYENPWDGKHRVTGTNLPTAVYYYIIEDVATEFLVEGSTLVGSVTLIRP